MNRLIIGPTGNHYWFTAFDSSAWLQSRATGSIHPADHAVVVHESGLESGVAGRKIAAAVASCRMALTAGGGQKSAAGGSFRFPRPHHSHRGILWDTNTGRVAGNRRLSDGCGLASLEIGITPLPAPTTDLARCSAHPPTRSSRRRHPRVHARSMTG